MARKTSFYYAFLVLPADQRRAIIAVWDFCRAVDDAVDEAEDDRPVGFPSPRESLACWRAELARCYSDTQPQTSQGRTLQPFVAFTPGPARLTANCCGPVVLPRNCSVITRPASVFASVQ